MKMIFIISIKIKEVEEEIGEEEVKEEIGEEDKIGKEVTEEEIGEDLMKGEEKGSIKKIITDMMI